MWAESEQPHRTQVVVALIDVSSVRDRAAGQFHIARRSGLKELCIGPVKYALAPLGALVNKEVGHLRVTPVSNTTAQG